MIVHETLETGFDSHFWLEDRIWLSGASENAAKLPLTLVGAGKESNAPTVYRPSGFPYHQFLFVTDGSYCLDMPSGTQILKKNTILLIPALSQHSYKGIDAGSGMRWVCYIACPGFLSAFGWDRILVEPLSSPATLLSRHKTMMENAMSNASPHVLSALLYDYCIHIAEMQRYRAEAQCEDERLLSVMHRLETDYMLTHSLDDLAVKVGMTRYSLSKAFRARYGITVFRCLEQIRLRQAKMLLVSHPEIPVHEIAFLVGYNDCTYFDRLFRRSEGITPLSYRRQFCR